MKFEKFLKGVGTHGEVINVGANQKWLCCGGVGMLIPNGVENLLGTTTDGKYLDTVKVLVTQPLDEPMELTKAILKEPTGGAKDIYRVFEGIFGYIVGISNADYGLLERGDRLGYCEINIPQDEGEDIQIKYLLVFDRQDNVIGFITGSELF